MKGRKMVVRLAARRKLWDSMSQRSKDASRRPGSNKKGWPMGRKR